MNFLTKKQNKISLIFNLLSMIDDYRYMKHMDQAKNVPELQFSIFPLFLSFLLFRFSLFLFIFAIIPNRKNKKRNRQHYFVFNPYQTKTSSWSEFFKLIFFCATSPLLNLLSRNFLRFGSQREWKGTQKKRHLIDL